MIDDADQIVIERIVSVARVDVGCHRLVMMMIELNELELGVQRSDVRQLERIATGHAHTRRWRRVARNSNIASRRC